MSDTSRRVFLATGAGAGAVAATGFLTAANATSRRPGSADEPVVAVVTDPSTDEVTLLVGEREVVVHDKDLTNRILNAAGGQ